MTEQKQQLILANELRLGNWVTIKDYEYFQVKKIDEKLVEDELGFMYSIFGLLPIQLTEEMLLKCKGIIKHPTIENRYVLKGSDISFNIEDGDWNEPSLDVLFLGSYITCVEFVHELQNLIFALTNQELEIELC